MSDGNDQQCAAHTSALIAMTKTMADGFGQGDKRMSQIESKIASIDESLADFKRQTQADIRQLKKDVRLARQVKIGALAVGGFMGLSSLWWVMPVIRFIGKVAQ